MVDIVEKFSKLGEPAVDLFAGTFATAKVSLKIRGTVML